MHPFPLYKRRGRGGGGGGSYFATQSPILRTCRPSQGPYVALRGFRSVQRWDIVQNNLVHFKYILSGSALHPLSEQNCLWKWMRGPLQRSTGSVKTYDDPNSGKKRAPSSFVLDRAVRMGFSRYVSGDDQPTGSQDMVQ